MEREVHLRDLGVGHVRAQAHHRLMDGDGLRHDVRDLAGGAQARHGVHLDELQEIARILSADQSIERHRHALGLDVLAAVAHGARHVHDHGRGALGLLAGVVDHHVVGAHAHGLARCARPVGGFAEQGVHHALRDVHGRGTVAEFVGPRGGKLHRAVGAADALVAAAACALQVAEDGGQQAALVEPHGLRRDLPSALGRACEACFLCQTLQQLVHAPLRIAERVHLLLRRKLLERVHVDDGGLGVLERLAQLFQEAVDLLELLLHLDGARHVERLAARERPTCAELVHLVLLAEPLERMRERALRGRVLLQPVPEPFQVAELLFLDRAGDALGNVGGTFGHGGIRGRLAECARRLGSGRERVVRGQDLRLALLEELDQRIDARPKPLDLRGIDADGVRQFLVGEASHVAGRHQVLEGTLRGRPRVRRLRGSELHGVVAQVGVEHPAQRLRGRCRDVGPGLIRRWIAVRFHGAHFTS